VPQRLPTELPTPPDVTEQLLPLLLRSHAFGHPVRLDYGSGHELSFVLALYVCVRMGYISGEEEEDDLVLRVFPRYVLILFDSDSADGTQVFVLGDGIAEEVSIGTRRITWRMGTRRLLLSSIPMGICATSRYVLTKTSRVG
jgi:hypothetical protein